MFTHRLSRRTRVTIYIVIGVVVAPLAWLGVRAFIAYDALLGAQADIASVRSAITINNFAAIPYVYKDMNDETSVAASMTSDPVWRAAEHVPVIGTNLTAVREVAATIRSLVVDGVGPIAEKAGGIDLGALLPKNGTLDMARIAQLTPMVASASNALSAAAVEADAIDTSHTLRPVTAAVDTFRALLQKTATSVQSAEKTVALLPSVLGATEPRRFLFVMLDNASDRPSGGAAVALAMVRIDNGVLTLERVEPIAALGVLPSSVSSAPDYPVTASALAASWSSTFHEPVDTVVAIDSTGLGYLAGGIGSLTLGSGVQLDAASTPVYLIATIHQPAVSAAQRSSAQVEALRGIMTAVIAGTGTTTGYLTAASHLVKEKRVLLWSSDAAEQALIAPTPLAGTFADSNSVVTTYGVFLDDTTNSALSDQLSVAAHLTPVACAPRAGAQSELTVTLTSTAASASITENLLIYGPVGFSPGTVSATGGQLSQPQATTADGRPASLVTVTVPPLGTVVVTATHVEGSTPSSSTVEIRTSPRWTISALTFDACR